MSLPAPRKWPPLNDKIEDIRSRLEAIGDELTDLSIALLADAVEAGETSRPAFDKRLSQARRAVEKAAGVLVIDDRGRHE